ncbi:MAG: hypothetical protein EAZ34_08900 [Polaromonas sp.]|nr:MAG: hypothetical protein EAZ34_08900 [Polaromonas sp.]
MNSLPPELARDALPAMGHAPPHTLDKARQSLSRCASATTGYVAEQPMRSVLIAAAAGAAVALLVASSRQRRNR